MDVGEIWRHKAFPLDDGGTKPKWLLVLGFSFGDVVVRTLTSQAQLRSKDTCSHDLIRPHYTLGVLKPEVGLCKFSWLDLREHDDIEPTSWKTLEAAGTISRDLALSPTVMCPLLVCAINAPGTTKNQAKAMWDSRAKLGC